MMRYGRLFTPGTDVGGGVYPVTSDYSGRRLPAMNAYRQAADSGLRPDGVRAAAWDGRLPNSFALLARRAR